MMNQPQEQEFTFPEDNGALSKQECAIILQKSLALSSRFPKASELAKAAGFKRQTLGDYLYGRHKPPKDKWLVLHDLLLNEGRKEILATEDSEELRIARKRAERLKALKFLMLDELEFFRDSTPQARKILTRIIPGAEVGYLSSLFSALYDEDELKIWKTFSQLGKEMKNE